MVIYSFLASMDSFKVSALHGALPFQPKPFHSFIKFLCFQNLITLTQGRTEYSGVESIQVTSPGSILTKYRDNFKVNLLHGVSLFQQKLLDGFIKFSCLQDFITLTQGRIECSGVDRDKLSGSGPVLVKYWEKMYW